MLVHEIVLVRGAEFAGRFGDLCLLRNREILPDLAVGKRHLALDGSVGTDGVAGVQQEIRAMPAHGGEGEQCRPRQI
jgi:hypothetical protein